MSQTKIGAVKAKQTIYRKFGEDYFRGIGAKGGAARVPKGFATGGHAARAGAIGGSISKRGPGKHSSAKREYWRTKQRESRARRELLSVEVKPRRFWEIWK